MFTFQTQSPEKHTADRCCCCAAHTAAITPTHLHLYVLIRPKHHTGSPWYITAGYLIPVCLIKPGMQEQEQEQEDWCFHVECGWSPNTTGVTEVLLEVWVDRVCNYRLAMYLVRATTLPRQLRASRFFRAIQSFHQYVRAPWQDYFNPGNLNRNDSK